MTHYGFPQGAEHEEAKLTDDIVEALRDEARTQQNGRGWMKVIAQAHGIALSTLCYAIGGETWGHVKRVKPVKPRERHDWKSKDSSKRRYCNACGRPKFRRLDCKARFHDIDHRRETSPENARKAHAAQMQLTPAQRSAIARLGAEAKHRKARGND